MAKRNSKSQPNDTTTGDGSESTKKTRASARPKRAVSADSGSVATPTQPEPMATAADIGAPAPPEPSKTFAARETPEPETPAGLGPSEDDIRHRAYQRYLERGGVHGGDFDDWLHAEQELKEKR